MNIIDIVLVTWNRPRMTELVIKALAKNTTTPSRLIVVDNGSDKETRDIIIEANKNKMVDIYTLLPKNYGLEPARNIGLRMVESDLFVSTDNDCLPQKGWLGKLELLMKKYPDYASIACRPQVMVGTGNIFDGHEEEDLVEFSHPGGSLRIMRTDLIKRVGGWRDQVGSRGQEEMHIAGELREIGYKSGFAVKVKCYHMFGDDGNWGYGELMPEEHGHRPVHHPAIFGGDDQEEVKKYV